MSTQQEDWIYLDEPLPEIHVREIISNDELLQRNPNFVALSDEEIYNHLLLMFENRGSIVKTYFDLHKDVTNPTYSLQEYYKHVLYHVNAKRKDYSTEESEQTFFETIEKLKRNPNYKTREKIKDELYEPFESVDNIEDENTIPVPSKKKLYIQLSSAETSVLPNENIRLETDKEIYNIIAGEFRKRKYVDEMYIGEHIQASILPNRLPTINEDPINVNIDKLNQEITKEDLFYQFTKTIIPSFESILNQIDATNTSDIHSLRLLFEKYGRNMEEIDIESYNKLSSILISLEIETSENEEQKEKKVEKQQRTIDIDTISYIKLHSRFWNSMMARIAIARDVPLYSDIINNAIAFILAEPFKADIYVPLEKQLEKLENGTLKLNDFLSDIKLLRTFNERKMLSDFREKVHNLQESGNKDIFKDLEEKIKKIEDLVKKTVDPEHAEERFSTKPFVQNHQEIEEIRNAIQRIDDTLEKDDIILNEDDRLPIIESFVIDNPDNDEDVETEEPEDALKILLEKYESTPLINILKEIQPILSRIQELTNMPWDLTEFIKIMIERTPPVIDIGIAMTNIDSTIRTDIIEKIRSDSFEEAVKILPIEQHLSLKNTYQKAVAELKQQKIDIFYLFISYWIIYVQKLILDDMFVFHNITNSQCKRELKGLGYPIEEGKAGRKGVLDYFVCILHEEGHDIPDITDILDKYTEKKQLEEKIKNSFENFTFEIDSMKQQTHSAIIYEGNIASEEAMKVYNTISMLKLQKNFKPIDLLKPYIKSIQLLPSIIGDAKERHKYILGCCYSQLDSDYQAKKNLPKRLNASKNYFARERIGKKDRPFLQFYGKPDEGIEFKKPDTEPDMNYTDFLEKGHEDWRDEIKEHIFFSSQMKEMIDKNNRQEVLQIQNEARRYLKALYITINKKEINEDLWNNIRNLSRNEIIGTIYHICYDLYDYTNKKEMSELEITLIRNSVKKTKDLLQIIEKIEIPDSDYAVFFGILQYILCKTLCYPGDVKSDNRKITMEDHYIVKTRFLENISQYITKKIETHINMRITPTMEEIDKRISEIREKRKMETIRKYEENPDLNKLVKQAKLQGIKIDIENINIEDTGVTALRRNMEDTIADFEGAREFEMHTVDPDETNIDTFDDW